MLPFRIGAVDLLLIKLRSADILKRISVINPLDTTSDLAAKRSETWLIIINTKVADIPPSGIRWHLAGTTEMCFRPVLKLFFSLRDGQQT